MLIDSIKGQKRSCGNASILVRFLKHPYFTASQYFMPGKRTSPDFRTMNFMQRPVLRAALVTNARSMHAYYIVVGPSKNSHFAISGAILY
ncbi:MAG TPA: hypothetical protein VF616_12110 [Duganella sp.]|uniref:hypothetical protein n=1 Tax=Duganella sp. TaxID=1904440 RepID=UPI002ED64835